MAKKAKKTEWTISEVAALFDLTPRHVRRLVVRLLGPTEEEGVRVLDRPSLIEFRDKYVQHTEPAHQVEAERLKKIKRIR